MKGLFDMFNLIKARHAERISHEVSEARARLDAASKELVKTLDEMLDQNDVLRRASADKDDAPKTPPRRHH